MSEHALLAAQGYLELGMVEEALAELVPLERLIPNDPEFLDLRLHALMKAERWSDAVLVASDLLHRCKEALPAYIHGAYALHELGRTAEARELLLQGPLVLREDPTFHYNIGCYEAVLGNREAAIESLKQSFSLDKSFCEFAKNDPDLAFIAEDLP